jgi:hypothetical protein
LIQKDFNECLLLAIDESLCILGDSPRKAILFHLEHSFKIKERNIPSNMPGFRQALEVIFGSGALYIENVIANRLKEKLGLKMEEKETEDFLEIIETARNSVIKKTEAIK